MKFLELPTIKTYLRLESDYTLEDDLLTLMAENAESYLKDAITDFDLKLANDAFKKKAELAGLVLVSDFYENRNLRTKVNEKTRKSVNSIIRQMEYSYESS